MPGLKSSKKSSANMPLVVAHRGASMAQAENTIAAFAAAVDQGADAVELDLRWTADGTAVVFHDPAIVHNNSKVAVKRMAYNALSGIRSQAEKRVPTLHEALIWAKDKIPLVFDIKDTRQEEVLISEVESVGFPPASVFSSFRLTIAGKIKALRPDWSTAWIIGHTRPGAMRRLLAGPVITRAIRWGIGALHFHHSWIEHDLLERCRQEGLKVAVWTVDTPAEISRFADLGVDAIITNVPDIARQTLQQKSGKTDRQDDRDGREVQKE